MRSINSMSAKVRVRWKKWLSFSAIGMGGAFLVLFLIGHELISPRNHSIGKIPGDLPVESVHFANASGSDIRGWLISPPSEEESCYFTSWSAFGNRDSAPVAFGYQRFQGIVKPTGSVKALSASSFVTADRREVKKSPEPTSNSGNLSPLSDQIRRLA